MHGQLEKESVMLQRYSFLIWYLALLGTIATIALIFVPSVPSIIPFLGLLLTLSLVALGIYTMRENPNRPRLQPRGNRTCRFRNY